MSCEWRFIIHKYRNYARQFVAPGLSDPFVQVALMPQSVFKKSSSKIFKTAVHKQTLDPFFNESFKLWVGTASYWYVVHGIKIKYYAAVW